MNVLVVGLGLIGGSMAKAMKQKTDDTVIGVDISGDVLQQALECGAIDQAASAGNLPDADFMLIALYPQAAVDFVRENIHRIPSGCLVIDLCGVKRFVCREMEALFAQRQDIVYIGGHPMAGREQFGFAASLPTLFEGASMILTPAETVSRNHRALAELFFKRLGFTTVTYATPERHDELIALTSQMAHIVSSAYVQSPAASEHMGFSAGSFLDMTRVAKLHEGMWTELFLHNADYLEDQLDHLIAMLEKFRAAISQNDRETLLSLLREGRKIKEALNLYIPKP